MPERYLDLALLWVVRIKGNGNKQDVVAGRTRFFEKENIVVGCVEKR